MTAPLRRPLHRPLGFVSPAERRAAYEAARVRSPIYNTAHWRRLRKTYLAAHPLCECGCGRAAQVVDHRVPHNGDRNRAFDWDNLQALTKSCHDAKTARQDGGFGNPVKVA
jgi:5-methylcytosine-specific restriction enzyme A